MFLIDHRILVVGGSLRTLSSQPQGWITFTGLHQIMVARCQIITLSTFASEGNYLELEDLFPVRHTLAETSMLLISCRGPCKVKPTD